MIYHFIFISVGIISYYYEHAEVPNAADEHCWDCLVNAGRQLLQWQSSKRKACLYKVYKDWHQWYTQSCLVWTSNRPYTSGQWIHNARRNTKFQMSSNHLIRKDMFLASLSNGIFSDVVSAIFLFDMFSTWYLITVMVFQFLASFFLFGGAA